MKHVHVECKPDEVLVQQLGFSKKYITHHSSKSRVFKKLSGIRDELAMVDEDPGSVKTTYERNLNLISNQEGIKQYSDQSGNRIVILEGKLEDWIISRCKKSKIDLSRYNLPSDSSDLHDQLNDRLANFERLIKHMFEVKNKGILHLSTCLK